MNDFDAIQKAFCRLPDTQCLRQPFNDRSCEQLRRAIVSLYEHRGSVGRGDLAGLVRHVLRRGILTGQTGPDFVLTVPAEELWPDAQLWKASDVQVVGETQSAFRLRAVRNWSAPWLANSERYPPFVASFREEPRRKGWPTSSHLPLDTAIQYGLKVPFSGYQGPGQRLAIRAAFFLKPGATLIVNLPTGTGKSLVAWAPALLCNPNELTVMVTPTIALAIDQERQLLEKYPHVPGGLPAELAWHSGLSDDARKAITLRLWSNSQRVLITSPESLVGALSRVLYQTARSGLLRYFVVDEAHLVAQWGNDFRPEFQAMSGLRRELIKCCPPGSAFRTLLLSATLTQESFDVLESLFSDGLVDSVNAVTLRPEPEYWQSPSQTRSERDSKVAQLLRVVPRPFLLYVTTKLDADRWHHKIKELEIMRCGCVHGATPNEERERVISRWRSGDLDCVVATSAFGLGMDKSDVRAIIHACIPESIDRFYQEVGRAGRDGCASVSILLACDEADRKVAQNISKETVISLDKGRDRWCDLLNGGTHIDEKQIWSIDLTTRPTHIQQDSDANVAWNLRTLVLMNRAGIIRLESQEPPDVTKLEHESAHAFDMRRKKLLDRHFTTAYVKILNDGHRDEKVWETTVKKERDRMHIASNKSFIRMNQLLSGDHELGAILKETYTITNATGHVSPAHYCSGCPACREQYVDFNPLFSHPEPHLVQCIEHGNVEKLQSLFRVSSEVVFVRIDNSHSDRERMHLCLDLIQHLTLRGVDEFAVPETWKSKSEWKRIHEFSPRRLVVGSSIASHDPCKNDLRLPRATFLTDATLPSTLGDLINMERPFHVIFAMESAIDPKTRRPFFSTHFHIRDYDLVQRLRIQ